MSSLDLLDNVELEGEPLTEAPTGYFENVGAAWDVQTQIDNANSRDKVVREELEKNFEIFNHITGQDFQEVYRDKLPQARGGLIELTSPQERIERERAIDNIVKDLKSQDPEKFKELKTYDESLELAKQRALNTLKRQEQVYTNADNGFARFGSFIGTLGGAMVEPINLITLPLGAGAGSSVLKTALVEAGIGIGTEALIQPEVKKWRNELGLKYGLDEIAANMAAAAVGGSLIGAGPKAIAKGKMKVTESAKKALESKTTREFVSRTRQIVQESNVPGKEKAIAALDHVERMAFVRETDPFSSKRFEQGLLSRQHEESLNITKTRLLAEDLSPRDLDLPYQRQFDEIDTTITEGMDPADIEAMQEIRKYQNKEAISPVKGDEPILDADLRYHREEALELAKRKNPESEVPIVADDFKDVVTIGKVNKKTGKARVKRNGKTASVKVNKLNKIDTNQAAVVRDLPDGSIEAYGLTKYRPEDMRGQMTARPETDEYNPIAEAFEARRYPENVEAERQLVRDSMSEEAELSTIADFNRLADEDPNMKITDSEGNETTLGALREELQADETAVREMKACATGE